MAFTLAQLRNKILTTIHGRRVGLDSDGFLLGVKGTRVPITDATSATTGTALPNHGLVSVVTTTNSGWTLADPVPGCEVELVTGSSSTGTHTVTFAAATAISSYGIASSIISMQGKGAFISLRGLSTATWAIKSILQTTAGGSVQISS